MSTDTGRNTNDKVRILFRALKEVARKLNQPIDEYFEKLVDSVIGFLKVKKSNMNMVILLQNLLIEFVDNGFDRVPEALNTIKPIVKNSPSYIKYV